MILSKMVNLFLLIWEKEHDRELKKKCVCSENTTFFKNAFVLNCAPRENIHIGANCKIRGTINVESGQGKVEIGDYFYLGDNSSLWCYDKEIRIGNRVLIAHNVSLFNHNTHPIDPNLRFLHYKLIINEGKYEGQGIEGENTVIGDDVWIGCNCVILKGVHIGKGTIISAGSVVVSDMPAGVMAGGNPARVIKQLTI